MTQTVERVGLVAAGLAWGAIGLGQLAGFGEHGTTWSLVWWVAFLLFGVAFVVTDLLPGTPSWLVPAAVWLQVVLAVVVCVVGAYIGVVGVILVLSAVSVTSEFPTRTALSAIGGQTLVATVGAFALSGGADPVGYLVIGVSFLSFELFAFLMVRALVESQRAHAELEAAQARLAESSRVEERLRIARDLHDAIGHQLTALAVNLEVASHTVTGPGAEQVELSRQAAKDVLADVREVVGRLRDLPDDMSGPLAALAASVVRPEVVLEVDPQIRIADPLRREAVFRCVQEALTNAARHSGAEHLWVSVEQLGGSVTVTARDDGRGSGPGGSAVRVGNGLVGMSERFAALGGEVAWFSRPGHGFTVEASLPVAP